jgi:hypothetical protein
MPLTERQRELHRRRRRRRKLRALKQRLAQAQDARTRDRLIEKIRRVAPNAPVPES